MWRNPSEMVRALRILRRVEHVGGRGQTARASPPVRPARARVVSSRCRTSTARSKTHHVVKANVAELDRVTGGGFRSRFGAAAGRRPRHRQVDVAHASQRGIGAQRQCSRVRVRRRSRGAGAAAGAAARCRHDRAERRVRQAGGRNQCGEYRHHAWKPENPLLSSSSTPSRPYGRTAWKARRAPSARCEHPHSP